MSASSPGPASARPPLLELRGVTKSYGENVVLRDVNLTVSRGEVVVIIGPSGSGKSTLLRCVAGLEPIQAGRIEIEGEPIREAWRLGGEVGFVFQQFNLFPNMTALRNVALALHLVRKLNWRDAHLQAMTALEGVGLKDKADALPSKLSGGQQQRVAIARSIAMNPRVMLFDEVTSALDRELVGEVLVTMENLAKQDVTMLVVTHELGFAKDVADRVLFIDEGVIARCGSPDDVLLHPEDPRLRRFLGMISTDYEEERLALQSTIGAGSR